MSLMEHTHCAICTKLYASKEDSEKCFWNHSEIEKLRWIANRVHNIKVWQSQELNLKIIDYELFSKIDKITNDYAIKDSDY